MTTRQYLLIILLAGMAFSMSACELPVPTPAPCMPGDFGVPALTSPADFAVVGSLTPTLSWDYPEESDCVFTGYRIDVASDPGFVNINTGGTVDSQTTSFAHNATLAPGTEYWWQVTPYRQGGPVNYYGEPSGLRRFFTPGYCEPGTLLSPELAPPDFGSFEKPFQPVDWSNGNQGCMPERYRVELAFDPGFLDPAFIGGNQDPSTDWTPDWELQDCMRYYLRVIPVVGSTLGPSSKTLSFATDFKQVCPPAASISGTVWHDLCAVPWGPSDPADLPEGCVALSGDGMGANGIFESGEPGIPGVTLRLGSGACPATGLATALTDTNGEYIFDGLSAGTYCLSVDALSDGNDGVLIPGGWTYPTPGDIAQYVEINLSGDVPDVNFGWDYQFLPEPDASAPAACFYQASRTLNCRASDDEASSLIAILQTGQAAKLVAVNPEITHGRFDLGDRKMCWVWFELMEGAEDPLACGVPYVDPSPTEEPQQCQPDLGQAACLEAGGTWQPFAAQPGGTCNCP